MPVPPDVAWALVDHIGHAYSVFLHVAEGILVDADVSVPEFVALAILAEVGGDALTQTEWGRFQGVSRQRAHVVTKTLADAGLVTVQRKGRSSSIRLSKKGAQFVDTWKPTLSSAMAENMRGLSEHEARTLSRLLLKMLSTSDVTS